MRRETGESLTTMVLDPEFDLRIPVVRVGHASFTPDFARTFWAKILSE